MKYIDATLEQVLPLQSSNYFFYRPHTSIDTIEVLETPISMEVSKKIVNDNENQFHKEIKVRNIF